MDAAPTDAGLNDCGPDNRTMDGEIGDTDSSTCNLDNSDNLPEPAEHQRCLGKTRDGRQVILNLAGVDENAMIEMIMRTLGRYFFEEATDHALIKEVMTHFQTTTDEVRSRLLPFWAKTQLRRVEIRAAAARDIAAGLEPTYTHGPSPIRDLAAYLAYIQRPQWDKCTPEPMHLRGGSLSNKPRLTTPPTSPGRTGIGSATRNTPERAQTADTKTTFLSPPPTAQHARSKSDAPPRTQTESIPQIDRPSSTSNISKGRTTYYVPDCADIIDGWANDYTEHEEDPYGEWIPLENQLDPHRLPPLCQLPQTQRVIDAKEGEIRRLIGEKTFRSWFPGFEDDKLKATVERFGLEWEALGHFFIIVRERDSERPFTIVTITSCDHERKRVTMCNTPNCQGQTDRKSKCKDGNIRLHCKEGPWINKPGALFTRVYNGKSGPMVQQRPDIRMISLQLEQSIATLTKTSLDWLREEFCHGLQPGKMGVHGAPRRWHKNIKD